MLSRCYLTFKEGVQHSLLDLGVLYHVDSCLGENELSRPRFETIPVVLNDWDAVLHKHNNSTVSGFMMYLL